MPRKPKLKLFLAQASFLIAAPSEGDAADMMSEAMRNLETPDKGPDANPTHLIDWAYVARQGLYRHPMEVEGVDLRTYVEGDIEGLARAWDRGLTTPAPERVRVVVEIADDAVIGVYADAPGVEVVIADHDSPDEFCNAEVNGMTVQRIAEQAEHRSREQMDAFFDGVAFEA